MPPTCKNPHHFTRLAIAITASLYLTGCYDYHGITHSVNSTPNSAPSASAAPRPETNSNSPSQPPLDEQTEEQLTKAVENCMNRFPEAPGHKADQIRCIVSSTDDIWDKAAPSSKEDRRALGSYAIQLAEREDRGEITRERAENLYMQFLQQTPGLSMPPNPSRQQ